MKAQSPLLYPVKLIVSSILIQTGTIASSEIPMVHTQYTPSFVDACCEKKPTPIIASMEQPMIISTPEPAPIKEPKVIAEAPKPVKLDSDKDGVYDDVDECPDTPKGYKVDKKGCPRSVILQIQFATGESTLLPSSDKDIKVLNDFMAENPASKITIIGHTDNVGGKKENQRLSEARASALATRLIQNGIERERINTTGKGMSQPIASNKKPAGRSLNRRIEIKIN